MVLDYPSTLCLVFVVTHTHVQQYELLVVVVTGLGVPAMILCCGTACGAWPGGREPKFIPTRTYTPADWTCRAPSLISSDSAAR